MIRQTGHPPGNKCPIGQQFLQKSPTLDISLDY